MFNLQNVPLIQQNHAVFLLWTEVTTDPKIQSFPKYYNRFFRKTNTAQQELSGIRKVRASWKMIGYHLRAR
jgi:hypothetical protein